MVLVFQAVIYSTILLGGETRHDWTTASCGLSYTERICDKAVASCFFRMKARSHAATFYHFWAHGSDTFRHLRSSPRCWGTVPRAWRGILAGRRTSPDSKRINRPAKTKTTTTTTASTVGRSKKFEMWSSATPVDRASPQ